MSRLIKTASAVLAVTGILGSAMVAPDANAEPHRVAYYQNCDAARAAGAAPIYRGQDGYRPALDRDGDGVACETGGSGPAPAPRTTPRSTPKPAPRTTPTPKPKSKPKRASNITRQFDRIHYVFCSNRRTVNLIMYQDLFGTFRTQYMDLNGWNGRHFCGTFDSIEFSPTGNFVWGSVRNKRSRFASCELRINNRLVSRDRDTLIGWAIC